MRYSRGVLRYSIMESGSKKLIVEVDQAISDVLFALTPRYFKLRKPAFPAHISVIRNEFFDHPRWGEYEGQMVEFSYDLRTVNDETYHWVRVYSERLSTVRIELGLAPFRLGVTAPPDGELCFHMTIGNTKKK